MFYSRLKNALREQNWFAVVLEIVIVVLGVVIGFQITAWSARQADLTTERGYLNQIATDVSTTQRMTMAVNGQLAGSELSAAQLFDSFRKIDPLPGDSILVLISNSMSFQPVNPVLGTIEALINTGDLGLVRNDSLRLSIPAYLEALRSVAAIQELVNGELMAALGEMLQMVDVAEANAVNERAGGTITIPQPQVNTSNPDYSTIAPFPFSAAEFKNSFEAYNIAYRIHHWKIQAKNMRDGMALFAGGLEEKILKELSK
jgi:hypothetical protein